MKDRKPSKPHRYAVYDEQQRFQCHVYLILDDEPTDEGTLLAKHTLLTDQTAAEIGGLPADPTPNDAFARLARIKAEPRSWDNIVIPESSWRAVGNGYSALISVPGVKATDNHLICDIVRTDDPDADYRSAQALACVNRITTREDNLVLRASVKPTISFNIRLGGVR